MRSKIPWKKTVKLRLVGPELEQFIKDLLSGSWRWRHETMFQKLTIEITSADMKEVRRNLLHWLERRKN